MAHHFINDPNVGTASLPSKVREHLLDGASQRKMAIQPIHVLGIGNLGKLLAHSIRKYHPATPIALLFHRVSLVDAWNAAGQKIDIVNGGQSDLQGNIGYESNLSIGEQIQNLIVATKTHHTLKALEPLRHRLSSSSNLLFFQNGIGTIDEVTAGIFPRSSRRPNYYAGVVNHGVYATGPFSSVHAGFANIILGSVSSNLEEARLTNIDSKPPFLLQQILTCPPLNGTFVSPGALLQAQMQKLVVNAVINPLTVIFNCRNGELFSSSARLTLVNLLIQEISDVVRAVFTARHDTIEEEVLDCFSAAALKAVVLDVGTKTSGNISSMRQDVLAGRITEIDYINGYVVAQAELVGMNCPLNARIISLVKENRVVSDSEISTMFCP